MISAFESWKLALVDSLIDCEMSGQVLAWQVPSPAVHLCTPLGGGSGS